MGCLQSKSWFFANHVTSVLHAPPFRLTILAAVLTALITGEVFGQHEPPLIKVGDTVIIKSRHRVNGVVIAFPGASTCDAYLSGIASIEQLIRNLPIEMIVQASRSYDYVRAKLVNDYHFKSQIYDDGFLMSRSVYHVEAYPTVIVVSPSGVVRYVSSLVVGSGYNSQAFLEAVHLSIAEGSQELFQGPDHKRGRMVHALGLHSEVLSPSFTEATVRYDPSSKAMFVWNMSISPTSFMIDSGGNVTGRYDMQQLIQDVDVKRMRLLHWDRAQERVLVACPDTISRTTHLRWYDMRAQRLKAEHALDALPERRRATSIAYHAPSSTFIQALRPGATSLSDAHPDAGAYCTNGITTTFFTDSLLRHVASSTNGAQHDRSFVPCQQGWISYATNDSIITVHDLNSKAITPHRISLPASHRSHIAAPAPADGGSAACNGIVNVLPDHENGDVFIHYRVPIASAVGTATAGCASFIVQYDMRARRVLSSFELPGWTEPFAAANGAVLCKRFDLVPARVVAYVAPETELSGIE